MRSVYEDILARVVRAREIWGNMHMLLTNNKNNTMWQYCGKLPRMTHVQSKSESKKLVKLSTSLLNAPLSPSLSLHLIFLYQDKRCESDDGFS